MDIDYAIGIALQAVTAHGLPIKLFDSFSDEWSKMQ